MPDRSAPARESVTERVLLVDPFSGASGDMLLASLLDAGLALEGLLEKLLRVGPLSACKLDARHVRRGPIAAVKLELITPPEQEHRPLSAIVDMVDRGALPEAVRDASKSTFELLASAEARVHGCRVDEVRFHEVGGLDAIVDIVGFHLALELMGIERCYYTRLLLGSGEVDSSHGRLPVPAPATVELLKGHAVRFTGKEGEMITPTAAALIAARFSQIPSDLTIMGRSVGYGAGGRESSEGLPNVLRSIVGETRTQPSTVCSIRSTIDDMNPELYGFIMEKLLESGALEVYYDSVMMKKNRPGLEVNVLCEEEAVERLSAFLLSETTTLGVRVSREERIELVRHQEEVETPFGTVRVKVAELPGGGRKAAPEFESCREAAIRSGARLMDVFESAKSAWMSREGEK